MFMAYIAQTGSTDCYLLTEGVMTVYGGRSIPGVGTFPGRPVPGRPRATTPAEEALSARRRRTTTVPQLVADHFQASGRRISATTVRNRLHNAGLYARKPVVCVPSTDDSEGTAYAGQENMFLGRSNNGLLALDTINPTLLKDTVIEVVESLVWAGDLSVDLHVFHGGTVTGLRYRDEILDPYVRPYAAAIGNYFILMDDNARPHRARIVEEYLEDHGLERMEWPARSPDLNLIEHFWDYLGREVAALNPPPRSLHELKQGLLCVWSSLPYSGVRQLNKQHGKSMPPMHSS
ncbi:transposable element Tcb2 transposase [Trichonephila clavipes]|nr:transposable element Tcb2 transposase [Trichonephila clavipes]